MQKSEDIVLTGDRPTGKLHVGHYVGSLKQRMPLQEQYKQFVMIADTQALTDHHDRGKQLRENIFEVMADYLAVGIDPAKTTIFLQSGVYALYELTSYFLNLVTVNRLLRNPTVKTEIKQKEFGDSVPAGFLMYPVSQAADITAFYATLVPVGDDQLPVIEQTNELVRSFNRTYNVSLLKEAKPLITTHSRLPGIDGQAKASKSLGNAIFLSDSTDVVAQKVKLMYTDPNHIKVSDPGKVEGNVVFTYLDAFDPRTTEVSDLKEQYQKGGLGDMVLKKRLVEVLETFLTPIRERRARYSADRAYLESILKAGTHHANLVAHETIEKVRDAIGILKF